MPLIGQLSLLYIELKKKVEEEAEDENTGRRLKLILLAHRNATRTILFIILVAECALLRTQTYYSVEAYSKTSFFTN